MEENIYKTPEANVDVALAERGYEIATVGKRFLNMIIDTIFFYIFAVVIGVILGLILGATGNVEMLDYVNDYVLGLSLALLYFLPQEAIWGRTIGKLITGTKVVNMEGKKISLGQSLGRTLCRFIPFEAFSFFGGNGRPRGWHDSIPNTKVVMVRR